MSDEARRRGDAETRRRGDADAMVRADAGMTRVRAETALKHANVPTYQRRSPRTRGQRVNVST
jgi:hypothetical protein